MKTFTALLLGCALGCALSACNDDPPPPVEAEPAPAAAPGLPKPAPAVDDSEPTAEEVPIVEDFEDQAEAEIKPDNLNAQLDAIEKEIELDK